MAEATAKKQRSRLKKEGMRINAAGYIQNSDAHFHVVGIRRNIRWSEVKDDEP
jgi:methylated-DNA-protein-cysteine methyltransferase-like protein